MFAHVGGIGAANLFRNLGLAFAGNLVGGAFFVASFYWYIYLRGQARPMTPAGVQATPTPDARSKGGQDAAGPR
jgi:hypothetical protein